MRRPNGYGGIVKLSGKRRKPYQVRITAGWETVIDANGNPKAKQIFHVIGSYPTYQDAALALAIYNNDPYDIELKNITFEQAYPLVLESRQPLAKNTMKGYKSAYKKSSPLYRKKLLSINKNDLQRIIDTQTTEGTQRQLISLFRIVFEWAQKDIELIKINPAENIKLTAAPKETREGVPYSKDEIRLLWRNLHVIKYVDTILMQIYLGLRITELLNIQKEDIHLDERWITIKGTKTKNAAREVPIRKEIIPLLKERMKNETEYLIVTDARKKKLDITYYSTFYDNIRNQLKFDHVTHDARHTFVSRADDAKLGSTTIKAIVGHSGKDITEKVYTHKDIHILIEEVDKIEFI